MRRFAWLLIPFALGACSSGDGGGSSTPSGSLVFEPEADVPGVSVGLRQKQLTGNQLVLELVGHGVTDLYGAAFRIRYDPAVLEFSKLEGTAAWAGGAPIVLGSAKQPGLLLGTVSRKGKSPGIAADGAAIAEVTFTVTQRKPASIELVGSRSALISANGRAVVDVSWLGGALKSK